MSACTEKVPYPQRNVKTDKTPCITNTRPARVPTTVEESPAATRQDQTPLPPRIVTVPALWYALIEVGDAGVLLNEMHTAKVSPSLPD